MPVVSHRNSTVLRLVKVTLAAECDSVTWTSRFTREPFQVPPSDFYEFLPSPTEASVQ